jgi:hypothetical protein
VAPGTIFLLQLQRLRRNDTACLLPIRVLLYKRGHPHLPILSRSEILLLSGSL